MKKVKNVICLILVGVLTLGMLAGCSSSKPKTEAPEAAPAAESTNDAAEEPEPAGSTENDQPLAGKKIAFICANQDDMYARYGKMMDYQLSKVGASFTMVMSDGSEQKELDNMNDLIVAEYDAIVLLPCNIKTGATTIKLGNDAGIPVFGIAQIADTEGTDAEYAGTVRNDQYRISVLVANYVLDLPDVENMKMVTIEGNLASSGAILTRDGFADTIEAAGLDRPESVGEGKFSREGALKVAQDLIASGKDWDLCFVGNEEMTAGVLQAMQENNVTGKTIVSCNGKPLGLDLLREGKMLATGGQAPTIVADLLSQMIIRYFTGEDYMKNVLFRDKEVITKDNLDSAITWDQDEYLKLKEEGKIETSLDYYAEQTRQDEEADAQ